MTRPRLGPSWGRISLLIFAGLALLGAASGQTLFAQAPPASPAQPAAAAPPASLKETSQSPRIYVPYKSLNEVLGNNNPTIFLPLKDFEALWEKVRQQIPQLPVTAALTGATYTATATPQTLTVTGELALQSTSKSWARLPLDFGAGKLAQTSWSDPQLVLHTNPHGQPELLVPHAGAFTGKLTVVYSVEELQSQHFTRLKLPAAAASTLELTVAATDQVFRTDPPLPLNSSTTPQESKAKLTLGRTPEFQVSWNPAKAPVTPVDRVMTAERTTRISLQEGTALTDSTIRLQILKGTVNQLRLAIPLTHQLLDVTAPNLKAWSLLKEDKRQIVVVDLSSPLPANASLQLRTESPFTGELVWGGVDAAGKTLGIELLDVHREQGFLILHPTAETTLTVDSAQGLVRIGNEELPPPDRQENNTSFRFFSPKHQLKFSAKPVEPRLLVQSQTAVLIGTDETRLDVSLDYEIERAGLFSLTFKLPPGFKLESVTCPDLQDQSLSPQSDQLKLTLTRRKLGELSVSLKGRIPRNSSAASFIAPLVEPQNISVEEGTISIQAPEALEIVTDAKAVKAAQPETATEEPQAGYRIVSTWSFNHRPVEIPLNISRKPPRLTAQTATTLNLRQKLLEVTTLLKLNVDYSGIRQFQFLLPEAIGSNLQIEELDNSRGLIKQKTSAKHSEAGWNLWTIETQREVLGDTQFKLRYDLPLQEASGIQLDLKLPRLLVPPAPGRIVPAAVNGEVAILKDNAWSLTAEATGLESIDVRELQQLPQTAAIAYRYFETADQPLTLKLLATKYETRDVVQTIITRALVEGVLSFEDQGLFRCRYRLTTSERQRLPVQLPAQVEPLSVSVAGQQVPLERSADAKPEDGTFFINVNRQTAVDQPFTISIVYRAKVRPISRRGLGGDLRIQLPQLGLLPNHAHPALQQQRLIVWLPRDVELVGESDHFRRRPPDHLHRDPQALAGELDAWIGQPAGEVYEFPVTGHPFEYDSLGFVRELSVQWWRMNWITILLSIPLVIVAWLTRRTSWSSKFGLLLFFGFILLLSSQQDLDWVRHLLHAGRFGLAFGLLIWIISTIFAPRHKDHLGEVGMVVPWGRVPAPVIPPPGIFGAPQKSKPPKDDSTDPPAS